MSMSNPIASHNLLTELQASGIYKAGVYQGIIVTYNCIECV